MNRSGLYVCKVLSGQWGVVEASFLGGFSQSVLGGGVAANLSGGNMAKCFGASQEIARLNLHKVL